MHAERSRDSEAEGAEKPFKLGYGGGLHFWVKPAGGGVRRFHHFGGGKEKLLSIGPYPDIVLSEAARDDAKAPLRQDRGPSVIKTECKLVTAQKSAKIFQALLRGELPAKQSAFLMLI